MGIFLNSVDTILISFDKGEELPHNPDGVGRLKVLWPCAIATALPFPRPRLELHARISLATGLQSRCAGA